MKRGDLYRVTGPPGQDPKKYRVFVVVSRPTLIASRFSTVICAPIYSVHDGLSTQVPVDSEDGLLHASSIHCDALMNIPKVSLTHYLGTLSPEKLLALNEALRVALDLIESA
jgi:mRNA interferase MazF